MISIAQKKAQLQAQIARLDEREKKLDTGQKVILGGWLKNKLANDPDFLAKYKTEIQNDITRKADIKRMSSFWNEL